MTFQQFRNRGWLSPLGVNIPPRIILLAALAALTAPAHALRSRPGHPHATDDAYVRIYGDAPSGSVVRSLPELRDGTRSLVPHSDLFFVANAQRDLVLAREIRPDEYGKSFEFLVVESSPNSISEYHVAKLKISIADPADRPFFNEPRFRGKIPENRPVDSEILMDVDIAVCAHSAMSNNDVLQTMEFRLRNPGKGALEKRVSLVPRTTNYNPNCRTFALVTNVEFDHEAVQELNLIVEAIDDLSDFEVVASAKLKIDILDENDNLPSFEQDFYDFEYEPMTARYPVVGTIKALDPDGDAISYENLEPHSSTCCIVVPQSGQVIVIKEIVNDTVLQVGVHEKLDRSRQSANPALVVIRRKPEANLLVKEFEIAKSRDKRRVTRAVRPTKRIEFPEAYGNTEGKVAFQLEQESGKKVQ